MRRREVLAVGATLAAGCAAPPEQAELTAPRGGPYWGETAGLRLAVHAAVVLAVPRQRTIVALDVASGRRRTLAAMPAPARQLSTPDDRGAVAVLTAAAGERRYALRLLADGRGRTVTEGIGDPLWDDPIGPLALSSDGRWLLAVAQPNADARFQQLLVGPLRCWGTGDGRERTLSDRPALALGERPAWSPDGGEIFYAAPGPQGLSSAAPLAPSMQPDPQIRRWHPATGRDEVLAAGHHPVLSSDGQSMLLHLPGPRGWQWWHIASASAQPMAPVAGLRAPLALVDSRYLICTAEPAPDAPVHTTVNNSPLAGPKPMLALKVADLHTGAHETLLDGIDPRLVLAARGDAIAPGP